MEFEKSVPFKNWTNEDFFGLYGMAAESVHSAEITLNPAYEFKAGGTYNVPASLALHFAKQLAIRELHKIGTPRAEMLSDQDVKANMDKCFPTGNPVDKVNTTSSFERLDEVKDVEAKPAPAVVENKTDNDVQDEETEDDDADVSDDKNNAGEAKFKRPVGRPKTRDAQYV